MGSLSWNGSKKDAVQETVNAINDTKNLEFIKKQNSPSGCWYLTLSTIEEKTTPTMFFDKITVSGGEVCVKRFDLSSGPCFYDMSESMFKNWNNLCEEYSYDKSDGYIKNWEQTYKEALKLKNLENGATILNSYNDEIVFKYYYTKSKSQLVATIKETGETFRYKTDYCRLIKDDK